MFFTCPRASEGCQAQRSIGRGREAAGERSSVLLFLSPSSRAGFVQWLLVLPGTSSSSAARAPQGPFQHPTDVVSGASLSPPHPLNPVRPSGDSLFLMSPQWILWVLCLFLSQDTDTNLSPYLHWWASLSQPFQYRRPDMSTAVSASQRSMWPSQKASTSSASQLSRISLMIVLRV